MTQDSAIRARLEQRLAELTGRLERLDEDLRQPLDADSEEQAADLADDEALEALEDSGRAEVAAINAALHRLEQGRYGECASCGEQIEPQRLQALPEAALCIGCARQKDARH